MLDPDVSKEYLDRVQGRSKEKKYVYDVAFGAEATNEVLTLSVKHDSFLNTVDGILVYLSLFTFQFVGFIFLY